VLKKDEVDWLATCLSTVWCVNRSRRTRGCRLFLGFVYVLMIGGASLSAIELFFVA